MMAEKSNEAHFVARNAQSSSSSYLRGCSDERGDDPKQKDKLPKPPLRQSPRPFSSTDSPFAPT
jgi:hypothetical protein